MTETDYICNKCQKSFANNRNLKRHMNNCNVGVGGSKTIKQNNFKCKHCGYLFTRKDSLTKHINKKRCKVIKKNIIKGENNKQNTNINCKNSKVNNAIKSPNSNNVIKIYNPIILIPFCSMVSYLHALHVNTELIEAFGAYFSLY